MVAEVLSRVSNLVEIYFIFVAVSVDLYGKILGKYFL